MADIRHTNRFPLEMYRAVENGLNMTIAEAKAMPLEQKFQIMEALWDDMRDRFEATPVSDEVKAMLDARRHRVACGQTKILDWNQVKLALGRG